MSLNKFLTHCILYIALLQLTAYAFVINSKDGRDNLDKSPSKPQPTTSVDRRPSPVSSTSTPVETSKTLSYASDTCPIKRGLGGGECVTQKDAPWHTYRISQKPMIIFKNKLNYNKELEDWGWRFPFTHDPSWGQDVIVYVVDSGVLTRHSAFNRKQFESGAYVPKLKDDKDNNPHTDEFDHGPGVASLIVGKRNGIARAATVFPIKVTSSRSQNVTPLDVLDAVNIAIKDWQKRRKNTKLRAVINISWSMKDRKETEDALKSAMKLGMHIVSASGNDGKNRCYEDTTPGTPNRMVKSVGHIIVSGVVPTFQQNKVVDAWHDSGNHGSCIDIAGPMEFMWVADPKRLNYVTRRGTSLAAPVVSGVVAALLSSGSKYRDLSPAKLKDVLLKEFTVAGMIHQLPKDTPDRMLMIKDLRVKV